MTVGDRFGDARVGASVARAALDGYTSLLAGDARPLIDLLHPNVEWDEGGRSRRLLRGRSAVAALLQARTERHAVAPFEGVVVRSSAVVLRFSRPWWDEHPSRFQGLLAAAFDGAFIQTVSFGRQIERIECSFSLFGSGWRD